MGKIIAIANQKGGVGKTVTAVNTTAALAKSGCRVLLIDSDPQANASSYAGYEPVGGFTLSSLIRICITVYKLPDGTKEFQEAYRSFHDCVRKAICTNREESYDYIPSEVALSGAEIELIQADFERSQNNMGMRRTDALLHITEAVHDLQYDYIIVDCPPYLGTLLVNALAAVQYVVVPVNHEDFALEGINLLLGSIREVQQGLNPGLQIGGFLLTITERWKTSYAEAKAALNEAFGGYLFQAEISRLEEANRSTASHQTLVSKGSVQGQQYQAFSDELIQRIGG